MPNPDDPQAPPPPTSSPAGVHPAAIRTRLALADTHADGLGPVVRTLTVEELVAGMTADLPLTTYAAVVEELRQRLEVPPPAPLERIDRVLLPRPGVPDAIGARAPRGATVAGTEVGEARIPAPTEEQFRAEVLAVAEARGWDPARIIARLDDPDLELDEDGGPDPLGTPAVKSVAESLAVMATAAQVDEARLEWVRAQAATVSTALTEAMHADGTLADHLEVVWDEGIGLILHVAPPLDPGAADASKVARARMATAMAATSAGWDETIGETADLTRQSPTVSAQRAGDGTLPAGQDLGRRPPWAQPAQPVDVDALRDRAAQAMADLAPERLAAGLGRYLELVTEAGSPVPPDVRPMLEDRVAQVIAYADAGTKHATLIGPDPMGIGIPAPTYDLHTIEALVDRDPAAVYRVLVERAGHPEATASPQVDKLAAFLMDEHPDAIIEGPPVDTAIALIRNLTVARDDTTIRLTPDATTRALYHALGLHHVDRFEGWLAPFPTMADAYDELLEAVTTSVAGRAAEAALTRRADTLDTPAGPLLVEVEPATPWILDPERAARWLLNNARTEVLAAIEGEWGGKVADILLAVMPGPDGEDPTETDARLADDVGVLTAWDLEAVARWLALAPGDITWLTPDMVASIDRQTAAFVRALATVIDKATPTEAAPAELVAEAIDALAASVARVLEVIPPRELVKPVVIEPDPTLEDEELGPLDIDPSGA